MGRRRRPDRPRDARALAAVGSYRAAAAGIRSRARALRTAAHAAPSRAELWAGLRQDRRYLAMLGLGFSSGIPYQLVFYTQSDWWTQAGVPIGLIGLMVLRHGRTEI